MAWSRFDDGFDTHPKIIALGRGAKGDARRWTWFRIVLYANRHDSPVIPEGIADAIPAVTDAFLDDCERVGLIDRDADGTRRVHDWVIYTNAPLETKVDHYLQQNPTATANQVHKAVGGKRDIVLKLYADRTASGSGEPPAPGSLSVPGNHLGTGHGGSLSVPGNQMLSYARAQAGAGAPARAPRPVPSRPEEEPLHPSTPTPDRDGRTDDTSEEPNPLANLHVLKDMPA